MATTPPTGPDTISLAGRALPARVVERLRELEAEERALVARLEQPQAGDDHKAMRDLAVKRAGLAPAAEGFRRLAALEREAASLREAMATRADPELADLAREELPAVESQAAALLDGVLAALVRSDDREAGSVMMELRAGTGGEEAGLWCRDLVEMYARYATQRGWKCDVLDVTHDGEGIRQAVLNVRGAGVWRELSFEAGVHSVKRVPATEAQGRIHTSTASVAVLPEPEEVAVKVDWAADVEEHVTTSQGPGGQNVNKVATAVQLHHKPSGIIIRMQESKSQQQNRAMARRLLLAKLHDIEERRAASERAAARRVQIGGADRSEKIRTYRWKEGIVADERLPGEYALRDVMAGDLSGLVRDLLEQETRRRLLAL
jgi:peptide chain release factor 1